MTTNTTDAAEAATLAGHRLDASPPTNGQRLYEAWQTGVGNRLGKDVSTWSQCTDRLRAQWEAIGADPAKIGEANEPWARSVLAMEAARAQARGQS